MKRNALKTITLLALIGILVIPDLAHAQEVIAKTILGAFDVVGIILSPIALLIMKLMSIVTTLTGIALNYAVFYTIINMKSLFSQVGAIDVAWGVVRDIANMGFIFVLLWASIKLILGTGGDTQRLIVNIIIAAILINFSLFFTKFAIDITNLLALTFYGAIAPDAVVGGADSVLNSGISNGVMDALRINSIWENNGLISDEKVFMVSLLSSVVLLITSFIFVAITVMLVVRFVVLIFVLILSPIAFVSGVLPGLDDVKKQWQNALIGQGFFAPIFFLLMYITLSISKGISASFPGTGYGSVFGATSESGLDPGAIPILINFAVIVAFLLTSLVQAKSWADKAPGGVNKLTKWAMGATGNLTAGTAGWLGRQTVGRGAAALANNQFLKESESKGSMAARLTLAASRKTGSASFDARATSTYENLGEATGVSFGKAGGKGGWTDIKKKKVEEQEKIAKGLGPDDETIRRAEMALEKAKPGAAKAKAQENLDQLKGLEGADLEKRKEALRASNPEIIREGEIDQELTKAKSDLAAATDSGVRINLSNKIAEIERRKEEQKKKADAERAKIDAMEKIDSASKRRKNNYAEFLEKNWLANAEGYGVAAAMKIRKGKSPQQDAVDALKKLQDSGVLGEKPPEENKDPGAQTPKP